MEYFKKNIYGIDLAMRDIREADIPAIVNYWHQSDPAYLESIGVDLKKIVSPEVTESVFRKSLPENRSKHDRITLVAAVNDRIIAYTNVNFNSIGDGYAHVHIIDKSYRDKGIARTILPDVVRVYFEDFGIENLYFQTSAKNKKINSLLRRAGLEVKETKFHDKPDGMAAVGDYHLYVVDKKRFLINEY